MIGHGFSTSQNACILYFKDGPYDGQSGMFDHKYYSSIHFHKDEYISDGELGRTNRYKWIENV